MLITDYEKAEKIIRDIKLLKYFADFLLEREEGVVLKYGSIDRVFLDKDLAEDIQECVQDKILKLEKELADI